MTLIALNYFPHNSGLASSMQSFIQMLVFALVSGLIAPLLFDSALKLAWGVMAGLLVSSVCWILVRVDTRRIDDKHGDDRRSAADLSAPTSKAI
jgi:DHA1 family bicyclomycin/chloramphenicol resistance-like MFS transporter